MRRADRLFEIIQLMRRQPLVRARDLAEKLEVSERTIYRDVRDLIASRVPIEGEAGVGYALRQGFDLPPLMFDEHEIGELAQFALADHRGAGEPAALLGDARDDIEAERLGEARELVQRGGVSGIVDAGELNPDENGARFVGHRRSIAVGGGQCKARALRAVVSFQRSATVSRAEQDGTGWAIRPTARGRFWKTVLRSTSQHSTLNSPLSRKRAARSAPPVTYENLAPWSSCPPLTTHDSLKSKILPPLASVPESPGDFVPAHHCLGPGHGVP